MATNARMNFIKKCVEKEKIATNARMIFKKKVFEKNGH